MLAALLATGLGGEVFGALAAVAGLALLVAWGLGERALRARSGGLLALGAAEAWVVWAAGEAVWLPAAVTGCVLVALVAASWGPEQARPRLALLLSMLLLVGAAARTESALFLPIWLAATVAAPVALWPSAPGQGARRARARLGLALGTLGVAAFTFVALPRIGGADVEPSPTGLQETLEAGRADRLADDPRVVATLSYTTAPPGPVRLRAAALDAFDGVRWRASVPARAAPRFEVGPGWVAEVWQADLGEVVLVPGAVVRWIGASEGLVQDASEAWRASQGGERRSRVEVARAPGWTPLWPAERERYLALPDRLDPRLRALVGSLIAPEMEAQARIAAVAGHLAANHEYSRVDLRAEGDPLARFLFEERYGHCAYFASATAVLLRLAEVPARVVTGFAGGQPAPGGWQFRGLDAHAWVEAFVEGQGWVPVDTTLGSALRPTWQGASVPLAPPPAPVAAWRRPWRGVEAWWAREVLGFSAVQQRALWAPVRTGAGWGLLAVIGLLLPAVGWLGRGRRSRTGRETAGRRGAERPDEVTAQWRRAVSHVQEAGLSAPVALPPVEAAQWYVARWGGAVGPLVRLAWLHYEVRYGATPVAVHLDEARRLAGQVCAWSPTPGAGPAEGA